MIIAKEVEEEGIIEYGMICRQKVMRVIIRYFWKRRASHAEDHARSLSLSPELSKLWGEQLTPRTLAVAFFFFHFFKVSKQTNYSGIIIMVGQTCDSLAVANHCRPYLLWVVVAQK